ncbi:MBL fold metallo-hydrolase [Patulibacter defluvii]|uniref:MBL fold metallo-hydrolase n=1 Tax=Patulibacter defluvii TaxID=3095358 RepID=UPI002A75C9B0|nr:MBL fold metallo-hydrolase [Patulibacter sp. DM4]
MRIRRLGWAGVEIEQQGTTVVIDLLRNGETMRAFVGDVAGPLPAPSAEGAVAAALVTHLHSDHADPPAIAEALAPDGIVLRPPASTGGGLEAAGLALAEQGLAELDRVEVLEPWQTRQVGPFAITAVPAVDGFGDPQSGWHVAAGGASLVHFGDTLFHGWWWPLAQRLGAPDVALLPINGATISLPHRQPPSERPAVMTPEDAVSAARILGAGTLVPIHYDAIQSPPTYVQVDDPVGRLRRAAEQAGVALRVLEPGEELEPAAAAAA